MTTTTPPAAPPRPTIGGRIAASSTPAPTIRDRRRDRDGVPNHQVRARPTTAKQNLAWYKNAWRKARGLPAPARAAGRQRIILDDTRENAEWLRQTPPADPAVDLTVTKTTKVERALAKTPKVSRAKSPKATRRRRRRRKLTHERALHHRGDRAGRTLVGTVAPAGDNWRATITADGAVVYDAAFRTAVGARVALKVSFTARAKAAVRRRAPKVRVTRRADLGPARGGCSTARPTDGAWSSAPAPTRSEPRFGARGRGAALGCRERRRARGTPRRAHVHRVRHGGHRAAVAAPRGARHARSLQQRAANPPPSALWRPARRRHHARHLKAFAVTTCSGPARRRPRCGAPSRCSASSSTRRTRTSGWRTTRCAGSGSARSSRCGHRARGRGQQRPRRHVTPAAARCLTTDQLAALLDGARATWPFEFWVLLLILARTGMRIGEAVGLQWGRPGPRWAPRPRAPDLPRRARVDPEERQGARGAARVPSSSTRCATSTAGAAWSRSTTSAGTASGCSRSDVRSHRPADALPPVYDLLSAARGLGLRDVTPHALRHTYASLCLAAGKELHFVQQQLGHASPAFTLTIYGHLVPRDRKGEVDFLDGLGTARRDEDTPRDASGG